jgi:phospholipase/carboxylesterase
MTEKARLHSRPQDSVNQPVLIRGEESLGLDGPRDALVYIPESVRVLKPAPLLVLLHGANGQAHYVLTPFRDFAEQTGTILLAPNSRRETWDFLEGGFGPDVRFIDDALEWVFSRFTVDEMRLGLAGFSDGASYALSLGLTNGDLFSHILAFSPGFMAPETRRSSPHIFISHGLDDQILEINHCSRAIVHHLQEMKLPLVYNEFSGGHTIPERIAREAFIWFLGEQSQIKVEHSNLPIQSSDFENIH